MLKVFFFQLPSLMLNKPHVWRLLILYLWSRLRSSSLWCHPEKAVKSGAKQSVMLANTFIFCNYCILAGFCVRLHVHLSLVIDVVEVLSDSWFRALALGVCGGGSRGDVAGGQAVQSGQTSAASNRSPEDQHGSTEEYRGRIWFVTNHEIIGRLWCVQPDSLSWRAMTRCVCVAPLFVFTTARCGAQTRKNLTGWKSAFVFNWCRLVGTNGTFVFFNYSKFITLQ